MRARAWKKVARRWWRVRSLRGHRTTWKDLYAENRAFDLATRPSTAIALVEALVKYAPAGSDLSNIGFHVIDDIVTTLEYDGDDGTKADQLLLKLKLQPDVLGEVLNGAKPRSRNRLPRLVARVPSTFRLREPGRIGS